MCRLVRQGGSSPGQPLLVPGVGAGEVQPERRRRPDGVQDRHGIDRPLADLAPAMGAPVWRTRRWRMLVQPAAHPVVPVSHPADRCGRGRARRFTPQGLAQPRQQGGRAALATFTTVGHQPTGRW